MPARHLAVPAVVAAALIGVAVSQEPGAAQETPRATVAQKASAARKRPLLKMIWGPNTMPDGSSAFPVYKQLGVKVLQVQLQWNKDATKRPANPTDPNDPAYTWEGKVAGAVKGAAAAGIKVCLLVKGTPGWANGDRGIAQAPDKDNDFANFVRAASKHFPSVHYWMIWGEPTRSEELFKPMPANSPVGPRRYATLLDKAYGGLKKASKSNQVIGADTYTGGGNISPTQMVKWMRLPNGKPPRMDMWGHNAFSRRFPDIKLHPYRSDLRDFSDLDTFHAQIKRVYARAHRKVPDFWLSEFTISDTRANRAFDFFVSRDEQAKWLTAAFKIAQKLPYVRGLGWFNLYDEVSNAPDSVTNGLYDKAGVAKPAAAAYKAVP